MILVALAATMSACATYTPPIDPPLDFLDRLVTESSGDISVSAAVLSDREAELNFNSPLAKKGIQPIWLEVENRAVEPLVVNFLSIDENYFAPAEAAYMSRRLAERGMPAKSRFFYNQNMPLMIEGQSTASGFIFTNRDPGAKAFTVELLGNRKTYRLEIVTMVPGFEADFMLTRPTEIYSEADVVDLDLGELRAYVESLPCCVLGKDLETPGDPLNVVFVGEGTQVLSNLVRRGWDLTETIRPGTSWRTIVSSVFGSRYRTSPVSPLYLFGRPQDAAFQKARRSVDERNHMRIWRAPVNLNGVPVWVGQISRDIGVKLSGRSFVTHRIDSVIDEARTYLVLDVLESGRLAKFGFAGGVGLSTVEDPRYNYTRDPYFTDGLRVVMLLSGEPIAFDEIIDLGWEALPHTSVLEDAQSIR